ncbi:MAG: hypothetical protein K8H74_14475 [Notoacmeibacter sp.]|nr:hypothetical protein [Notoacmeibacter sp.]
MKIRQHMKIAGQVIDDSIIAGAGCPLPVVRGGRNPVDMPFGNANLF